MMKLSVISFTDNGETLARRVRTVCGAQMETVLFTKKKGAPEADSPFESVQDSLQDWAKGRMEEKDALLFIGACGIAVRAIAPHVTDKLTDSPVLVTDELGRHVIPILSGHVGGANELALFLAETLGADPVITTATDLNGKFAPDLFAKKNFLTIRNRDGIAKVAAKALRNETVTVAVEAGHFAEQEQKAALLQNVRLIPYPCKEPADVVVSAKKPPESCLLHLIPQEYVIGAGCRKGKEPKELEQFLQEVFYQAGIQTEQVFCLASVDLKKEEAALIQWGRAHRKRFETFCAEDLRKAEGAFTGSAFVEKTTGVDNVCERAAILAAGKGGELVFKKTARDGMTAAVAKREWRVKF